MARDPDETVIGLYPSLYNSANSSCDMLFKSRISVGNVSESLCTHCTCFIVPLSRAFSKASLEASYLSIDFSADPSAAKSNDLRSERSAAFCLAVKSCRDCARAPNLSKSCVSFAASAKRCAGLICLEPGAENAKAVLAMSKNICPCVRFFCSSNAAASSARKSPIIFWYVGRTASYSETKVGSPPACMWATAPPYLKFTGGALPTSIPIGIPGFIPGSIGGSMLTVDIMPPAMSPVISAPIASSAILPMPWSMLFISMTGCIRATTDCGVCCASSMPTKSPNSSILSAMGS